MLRRVALALLAVAAAGPAFGQAYPNKPVKMLVPSGAGGPTAFYAGTESSAKMRSRDNRGPVSPDRRDS